MFYLDEAQVEMTLVKPVSRVRIRRFRADPEVSAANRTRPNPIAFPEITVSRINAYHVAVRLPADRGDARGRPQGGEQRATRAEGQVELALRVQTHQVRPGLVVEARKRSAHQDMSVGFDRQRPDFLDRAFVRLAEEGPVEGTIGFEPGQAAEIQAADRAELAGEQEAPIGLQGQGVHAAD